MKAKIFLLAIAAAVSVQQSCTDSGKKTQTASANTQYWDTLTPPKFTGEDNLPDPYETMNRGRTRPKPPKGPKPTPTEPSDSLPPNGPIDSGDPEPTTPGTYRNTIYLDFDGEQLTSSYWSVASLAPSGLPTGAQDTITMYAAQKFAPYNVKITRSLADYLAADPWARQRVIITPTSDWRPGVSGITYNSSMWWGDGTPCFVFSDRLYNHRRWIAEIVCHEAGHAVGLNHQMEWTADCQLITSYRYGVVMGNSLNLPNGGPFTTGTTFCNVVVNEPEFLDQKLGNK
jgi:hypothetical protein